MGGFSQFNADLDWFVADMPSECNWKKIPNTLRVIAAEESRLSLLPARRITTIVDTLNVQDDYFQMKAPSCGSPKAFVEDLIKHDTQSRSTVVH